MNLASFFQDFSWDGRQYQSEAVSQIHLGFNPILNEIVPPKWDNSWALWINSLSKVQWILAEIPLDLGFNMGAIKYLNWLVLVLIGLASWTLSKEIKISRKNSLLICIASISCIPIIQQLTSFYADAFPLGLMIIYIILCTHFFIGNYQLVIVRTIPMLIVLLVSVKLTQLIPIIFVTSYMVLASPVFRSIFSAGRIAVFSFVALILNINPYLTNYIFFGNPGYPFKNLILLNENSVLRNNLLHNSGIENFQNLVYEANIPIIFKNLPTFVNSIISPFITSNNNVSIDHISFFANIESFFTKAAFSELIAPDIRIGGLGFIFPLIAFLTIFIFFQSKMERKVKHLLLITLFSVVLTPYGWWARYTGYSWVVIVITLTYAIMNMKKHAKRSTTFLIYSSMFLIILQGVFYASAVLLKASRDQAYLNSFSYSNSHPLILDAGFSGYRFQYLTDGTPYVLDNLEVDFYRNQVATKLSKSESFDYAKCYSLNDKEISTALLNFNTEGNIFNTGGLMKLKKSDCDLARLVALEKKRASQPFTNISIFDELGSAISSP